ncbi:hypothetical protein PR048_005450 [Dryococelus australis]|uniref:Uncharacterized protein n=1 Tax=Dryococelus australis TaxID=614101 RepID=A0ABQ9I9A6_9NEOP|nr:hypothetical protein PR048_005450 [Dryococelus australis]
MEQRSNPMVGAAPQDNPIYHQQRLPRSPQMSEKRDLASLNIYGLESQLRVNDVCMEQHRNASAEEREIPKKTRRPTVSSDVPARKSSSHEASSNLVSKPFNRWKDALETFEKETQKPSTMEIHKEQPTLSWKFFDCKQADFRELLSQNIKTDAERNSKIISATVETFLFFGRQEVSLRGHRDSERLTVEEPTNSDGNFRALLHHRFSAGDSLMN